MPPTTTPLHAAAVAFYRAAMQALRREEIPFLVGGAYALHRYAGIQRYTKDFDVFVRPADCFRALRAFAAQGWRAELTFPHWLGKAYYDGDFVDVIFSSGNGMVPVDEEWFTHAVPATVLDEEVLLVPAEEIIWSKAYIMERERFDGADIAHLLRARGEQLDWHRLRRRFGVHWQLLLVHLILFRFIYPDETLALPPELQQELLAELEQDLGDGTAGDRLCQGTLLSREQYLRDITDFGYTDARLPPHGNMTAAAIAHWTAAIGNDTPAPPAAQAVAAR